MSGQDRSNARVALVLAAIVVGALVTGQERRAHADLVGPRDVERALAALEDEDDDDRRARAAGWLGEHGPDELVAPRLIAALASEENPTALAAIAVAVARRARTEDAARLLELEPTLRAAARAPVVVALAQLGTAETDAWLVTRLAGPTSSELRPAFEEAGEIARQRRDAVLPRAIEALAAGPSPLLLAWVASLGDERARGTLLTLALGPPDQRPIALEGLGRLAPSSETAAALRALAAGNGEGSLRSAELARALLAADPSADVSAFLEEDAPLLRVASLDALVRLAPSRAVALLGPTPSALQEEDRHVLAVARAHPSLPLVPWLLAEARDASLPEPTREEALEALVRIPACDVDLTGVASPLRAIADARLARVCPSRTAAPTADDVEGLHLRAIAGQDVRAIIGARFAAASIAERIGLAHGWLAGRLPDEAILDALEQETDPEVFAVLAAASVSHHLESDPSLLGDRLADPRTRQAALALLGAASARDSAGPRVRRAVARALSDPDPVTRAAAFHAARGLPAVIPHACAALASPILALRRAAWASLPPDAPCLARRARVDQALRAWRAQAGPGSDDGGLAVVRVVENGGGPVPRVSIAADDGRWLVLRPPAHGVVALPGLPPSTVRVVLEEEPVAARER